MYDQEKERFATAQVETAPAPPVVIAAPQPTYQPAAWPLHLVPFGVGQFANHDPVAGCAFLAIELALLATHIVSTLVMESGRDPRYRDFRDYDRAVGLWYSRTLSGAALIGVAIAGVVDAGVWSPTRGAARLTLAPAVGPTGLGIAGTF